MTGTRRVNTMPSPSPSESRSASTLITNTIDGSHDFKITGYSLYKNLGIGKRVISDPFRIGGYSWRIHLSPDGETKKTADYVAIYLGLDGYSTATEVRARFKMEYLDQSGKGSGDKDWAKYPSTFSGKQPLWGWNKFLKTTYLEASEYLKHDCLHIRCHIAVVRSHTEHSKISSILLPPLEINQDIGRLLESGEGADVTFEVDGEIFAAHKCLLAARSPVFKAQLFGPMKEQKAHCIKVQDMEGPIFKALLHFIYWDALPDLKKLIGMDSNRESALMSQHLLAAADRYCIDRLRLVCLSKLYDNISIDNVSTTLALADQCKASSLKSACLDFIALPENLQAVLKTDDFKYLKGSCPNICTEILEYVSITVQKQETFLNGVRVWIQNLSHFFRFFGCISNKTNLVNEQQ